MEFAAPRTSDAVDERRTPARSLASHDHPAEPGADGSPREASRARRAQQVGLLGCVTLLALLMGRFLGVYQEEASRKLTDATAGELDVAVWAAWATAWLFNSVAYIVLALAIGALGAAGCRWWGVQADFRRLRHLLGAVIAGYLAVRTGVLLLASLAGAEDRTVLSWLSAPEPGLAVLAVVIGVLLRRIAPGLGWPRTAACAALPAAALALLMAVV